jgi:pimeloyl-ACP methyl ester carboxylesterase
MAASSFRTINPINWSMWSWLAVLLAVCLLPVAASAQKKPTVSIRAVSSVTPHGLRTAQQSNCPNQGGIIDHISVPVGQPGADPLMLSIVIDFPAPPGGYFFQVASLDPTIAAAGDPAQALLPTVFIPEGQTQSNTFLLYGKKVGATFLESSNPAFVTLFTPTAVWDVNPLSNQKFLDANYPSDTLTCRDPGSPNLSSDPTILSGCGQPAQGAVSDGASQLLMRMVAGLPGTACFEITSTGPPDQGNIPTPVLSTQTLGSFDYGFSFYQAPNGYGDSSDSRTVQVQFLYTPSEGYANTSVINSSLTIIRPPLLLIHGLWSKAGAWPALWDHTSPYYIDYRANYADTNASNYSVNYPMVKDFAANALQKSRDQGYAATQADVTAHSMGGLLTRLYAGSPQYTRPNNFNLGDVHRLVTVDTPHFGASLANLLVSLDNNSIPFVVLAVYWSAAAQAWGFITGDIYQGAICDLSENSPALQGLSGGTSLPSQVITATGGPPGAPNGGKYWFPVEVLLDLPVCLPTFIPTCIPGTHLFPQDIVNGFRFRQSNDTIVSLTSQKGGLMGINFDAPIHTNVLDPPNGMNVASTVFSLLDGPASGFASSLQGVPSDGLGHPIYPDDGNGGVPGRGSPLDQQDYKAQCRSGGPMNPNALLRKPTSLHAVTAQGLNAALPAANPAVAVTSPVNGQRFGPGDTVNATVQLTGVTANAGYLAVGALGLGVLEGANYNGSSYQVSFVIPANYAGPLTLTPAIIDSNSNPIEGVGVTIAVRPKTAPLSLFLVEGTYNHLLSANATANVYVTGNYPDRVELDLTSSVTGTTYKSSNNQVLTVDAQGDVQAKAFGTAVVTVQNRGLTAFATFDVEDPSAPLAPQDLTASLQITRSGFRVDRNTGAFVQTIQFTNSQAVPIIGPLYFTITGLAAGVSLINSGLTKSIPPPGSPYFGLSTPDGITLQPGASLSLTLQFLDPSRARIDYTPKVFRVLTTP